MPRINTKRWEIEICNGTSYIPNMSEEYHAICGEIDGFCTADFRIGKTWFTVEMKSPNRRIHKPSLHVGWDTITGELYWELFKRGKSEGKIVISPEEIEFVFSTINRFLNIMDHHNLLLLEGVKHE